MFPEIKNCFHKPSYDMSPYERIYIITAIPFLIDIWTLGFVINCQVEKMQNTYHGKFISIYSIHDSFITRHC